MSGLSAVVITAFPAAAVPDQGVTLGAIVALTLIALLTLRELAAGATGPAWHSLASNLMVVIVPLLIIFILLVISRVLWILF